MAGAARFGIVSRTSVHATGRKCSAAAWALFFAAFAVACGSDSSLGAASGGKPGSGGASGAGATQSTGSSTNAGGATNSGGSSASTGSGGATEDGGLHIFHDPDASSGGSGNPESAPDAGKIASSFDGSFPDGDVGDASFVCSGSGSRYATSVVSYHFGPGQNYGQNKFPTPVLGPPHGASTPTDCEGGLDVMSLGNGGDIVLAFAGNEIVDGPGPDFITFENPYYIGCDPTDPFAELATVSVSEDGKHWTDFPCTATKYPYGMCSGWHPVYANPDTNDIDPTDPAVAGGDDYDLADIGVKVARYVKITDRVDLTGTNGVYDLDAVSIVNPACP